MNNEKELEYFQNKLKETMGKGIPKKYLESTHLGDVSKEMEDKFKKWADKNSSFYSEFIYSEFIKGNISKEFIQSQADEKGVTFDEMVKIIEIELDSKNRQS